jgi:uncharacterized protein YbaR (Trm112 family)
MKLPAKLLSSFLLCICLLGCKKTIDLDAEQPIVPEGFNETLLDILRCPENGSGLRFAKKKELAGINDRVSGKKLKTWAGTPQTEFVEAVLIRADGKIGYRVDKITPVMLIEEALVLDEKIGPPDPKNNRK